MNFITRILNRFTETRSLSVSQPIYPWTGGLFQDAGMPNVTGLSAMQSATVYSCVRLISESIASLPRHVYRQDETGTRQRDTTHPVQRLIYARPNSDMTSFTLFDYLVSSLLLHGRAFAKIEHDPMTARPVAIWPLAAADVYVYRRQSDGLIVYIYKGEILRPDEVIHLIAHTRDGITGLGPVQLAAASVGLDIAMRQYGEKFFVNGGHLRGVLERSGNMSTDAMQEFKREWTAGFEGVHNAHKTPLLPVGVKYTPISISPEASQFLESRRFSREEICGLFRVPITMLDSTKSSYATLEQANLQFLQSCLVPWLTRIEQEFSKLFLESEQGTYSVKFNVSGLLRSDTAARQSYYASGRQWGYLSVNDIRALEDLPPIDGGDVYLQPVNMQATGTTAPAPSANRQIIEDAARRLLVKESKALQRAIKKYAGQADGFKQWLDDWYTRHESLVSRTLTAPMKAAGVTESSLDYAHKYCQQARQITIDAFNAGAVDDLLDDLESIRASEMVCEIFKTDLK